MWSLEASCKDHPVDLWFGAGELKQRKAIKICEGCPVRPQCLEEALTFSPEQDLGVRGGMSKRARDKLRDRRSQRHKYRLSVTNRKGST